MKRLVLWDVDGTLIKAGEAGRTVFDTAVARTLARELSPDVLDQVTMSGKTDPQIAREILLLAEVADDEVDRHLPDVLRHLEAELAAAADRIRERATCSRASRSCCRGCTKIPTSCNRCSPATSRRTRR
ncbi:MAG TPA: hypothetical protein VM345_20340 [Acidimicrobiales bacterium]|nr:hypothetical protein [Acidimicrobiales bacterium]